MDENHTAPSTPGARPWLLGVIAFVVLAGVALAIWIWLGLAPFSRPLDIETDGGMVLVYGVAEEEAEFDMDLLVASLLRRTDPSGTRYVTVRAKGDRQVQIILPGMTRGPELDAIQQRITSLGTLEFRILAHVDAGRGNPSRLMERALQLGSEEKAVGGEDDPLALWVPMDAPVVEMFHEEDDKGNRVTKEDGIANANGFCTRRIQRDGQSEVVEILVIKDPFDVNGSYLSRVAPGLSADGHVIEFFFNAKGATKFGGLTTRFQPDGDFQYHLAIILDGHITSAPTIRSVVTSSGQITGYHGLEGKRERDNVIAVLKSGALPARLTSQPVSETRVEPSGK